MSYSYFNLVSFYSSSVILSLPPTAINRLSSNEKNKILSHKNYIPYILEQRANKIILTDDQLSQ